MQKEHNGFINATSFPEEDGLERSPTGGNSAGGTVPIVSGCVGLPLGPLQELYAFPWMEPWNQAT